MIGFAGVVILGRSVIDGFGGEFNKMKKIIGFVKICVPSILLCFVLTLGISIRSGHCEELQNNNALDEKVRIFLENTKGQWRHWNIPYSDGKVLYDLIIKNKYTRAVEIGTSTGLSAIWIAWALSKTGGKLITIEIDEGRHKKALVNFREAGLSEYIDARLADAHELVEELKGPFDFVFADADKDWSKNYFIALAPKLEVGGCFTAHNARNTWSEGISEFIDYVKELPNFKTTIDTTSSAGISISYKIAEK
jgi:predicted O-methyltransferase YrrM